MLWTCCRAMTVIVRFRLLLVVSYGPCVARPSGRQDQLLRRCRTGARCSLSPGQTCLRSSATADAVRPRWCRIEVSAPTRASTQEGEMIACE